jgi:predicted Zn-dependent protease
MSEPKAIPVHQWLEMMQMSKDNIELAAELLANLKGLGNAQYDPFNLMQVVNLLVASRLWEVGKRT